MRKRPRCSKRRVHKAAEQGAKMLYDPGRKGAVLPPITVDFVPHHSELVFEETFGPIIPIVRVPNDDAEVIRISNSTPFGLSSGVCTNDLSTGSPASSRASMSARLTSGKCRVTVLKCRLLAGSKTQVMVSRKALWKP